MLYGINAIVEQIHFSNDAVLDAVGVGTPDVGPPDIGPPDLGTRPPAPAPDTPLSTR